MIQSLFPPRKWGVQHKINHFYLEKQSMTTKIGQNGPMHRLLLGNDSIAHQIQVMQIQRKWKLIHYQSVVWWITSGREVVNL